MSDGNGDAIRRPSFATVIAIAVAASGAVVGYGYQANQLGVLTKQADELKMDLRSATERGAANVSSLNGLDLQLKEIETQFCATDIVRNLMHAGDLRQTSLLWEKVFGVPYPTNNAYYPTICNRHDGK